MASSNESVKQTLAVAFSLCVICSILVSGAAVVLKPLQDANKILDRNKNILSAAGLFDPARHTNADVEALFSQFTPRIVDLQQGRLLAAEEVVRLGIDTDTYDPRRAVNDPRYSRALAPAEDPARIRRQLLYPMVYVVGSEDRIEQIVVPISGFGLWGGLYGFLALEGDANTVKGIGFYELKETPGLGAEVTNPSWRGLWSGKKIYSDDGTVALRIVRGAGSGASQISGLAGATLTNRGVEDLIQFWMGEQGFGPFLQQLVEG